jgi:23S rRNA (guanosine2251-2'-O)-methyltransferase
MKKPLWDNDKNAPAACLAGDDLAVRPHTVRDALLNPRRTRLRLIVTPNAAEKLGDAIAAGGLEPEISDPRRFAAPHDPESVHQGAALEVKPLDWGGLRDAALADGQGPARIVPPGPGPRTRTTWARSFAPRGLRRPRGGGGGAPCGAETGSLAKAASARSSAALSAGEEPRRRPGGAAGNAFFPSAVDGEVSGPSAPGRVAGRRDRPVALCWAPRGPACATRPAPPATSSSESAPRGGSVLETCPMPRRCPLLRRSPKG